MQRNPLLAVPTPLFLTALVLSGCATSPAPREPISSVYDMPLSMSLPPPQLPQSVGVGLFGGLGAGQSDFHDYELDGAASSLDDSDTSFSAFGGYRWTPNYGMLIGYIDHGKIDASGPVGEAGQPFTDKIEYKSMIVCGMGTVPIVPSLAAFGLVGAAYWQQDVKYEEVGQTTFKDDSSGISPCIGAGVNYFIDNSGHFGLNLNWLHIFEAGDKGDTGHDSDIDFIALGFMFSQ
ncbi:MAG TPA: outer membrane beta-barrel protein [Planctomycetota bacterium]|nr:outer membrane beta-barrel protein [Planctomycetota bacterium]